jgi:hypothetical protein
MDVPLQSGSFPTLVEEIDNQDESTQKNIGETDKEAQDPCPAFDNDLDLNVDNIEIEEDDCIFMVIVHLVNLHYFICALSIVSIHLAEAFARNSKPKRFYETMLMALLVYEDVFSNVKGIIKNLSPT